MKLLFSKITVPQPEHFIRRAGYGLLMNRRTGAKSYVHRLHGDLYPHFHLYVDDLGDEWSFNLHLDQRAPVYEGVTAHAGEYDGTVVEGEATRLQAMVK